MTQPQEVLRNYKQLLSSNNSVQQISFSSMVVGDTEIQGGNNLVTKQIRYSRRQRLLVNQDIQPMMGNIQRIDFTIREGSDSPNSVGCSFVVNEDGEFETTINTDSVDTRFSPDLDRSLCSASIIFSEDNSNIDIALNLNAPFNFGGLSSVSEGGVTIEMTIEYDYDYILGIIPELDVEDSVTFFSTDPPIDTGVDESIGIDFTYQSLSSVRDFYLGIASVINRDSNPVGFVFFQNTLYNPSVGEKDYAVSIQRYDNS